MEESKMTKAEAAHLGGLKGGATNKRKSAQAQLEYESNPKKCLHCNNALPYGKRRGKFCSQSCAASFNNKGKRKHGKAPGSCLKCGLYLKGKHTNARFCCSQHQADYQYDEYVRKWLNGDITGSGKFDDIASAYVYRWVGENQGKGCKICGVVEWTGKPVPLVLDHIDGNPTRHRPENLRYICRNCDGLLPTFSGKNIGNGRARRRQLRKEGKLI